MKPFRFEIGSLVVEVCQKRIVMSGRWPSSPHLTAFLTPQPQGSRWAGFWTPHISFVGGRKLWLGRVDPDAMKRFSDGVGRDLYALWAAATNPVDLADLSRDEWFVYAPTDGDAFLARLDRIFAVEERRYRLNDERFERFGDEMFEQFWDDCIDPLDLADGYDRTRPHPAMRVALDGTIERCWVSARYTPEDGRGAWQRTRWDWLPEGRAEEIYFRHSGDEFRRALSKIARALRLHDPFAAGPTA